MELMDIFALEKESEEENFRGNISNHVLLWHGACVSDYAKILFQGFKFQTRCQDNVYKFGRGLTFYDTVSTAAQYCNATTKISEGYILLCELALGQTDTRTESNDDGNVIFNGNMRYD